MSEPLQTSDGETAEPGEQPTPATEPFSAVDISLPTRKRPPLQPGLYVVATPIGNLEDITLRALRVLREADRVGCEDTRQTAKLLHHFGIATPTVSLHRHNEHQRSEELLESLRAGARIALVTDAGTPGIADPGTELIRNAIAAGLPVYVVPGANAVLAAVVGSGMAPPETGAFRFHGFLPARAGERRTALEQLRSGAAMQLEVFYEAPHRLLDTLADLRAVFGASQTVGLARELTKVHEEFLRGPVADLQAELSHRPTIRGEFVLLLPLHASSAETPETAGTPTSLREEVQRLIQEEKLSEMDAIKQVARSHGLGKSAVYREWQRKGKS